jgi:hypothetical protein
MPDYARRHEHSLAAMLQAFDTRSARQLKAFELVFGFLSLPPEGCVCVQRTRQGVYYRPPSLLQTCKILQCRCNMSSLDSAQAHGVRRGRA